MIFIVILWIFKEVRSRYIKEVDFETARIDKILEAYGAIETSLIKYLRSQESKAEAKLVETFGAAYSFISRDILKSWSEYLTDPKVDKLEVLLNEVQKEISLYNYEQTSRINIYKKEIITYYLRYFQTFFVPTVITFSTLLSILFVIFFFLHMNNPETTLFQKVDIFAKFGSSYLIFLLIYILIYGLFDKKFSYKKNWYIIGNLFILLLFVTIWLVTYLSVFYFPLIIYFLFFLFPKMIVRS